jgi:acyl-CoA synthetase (AMP-forming)/AMP-acid ligase II
MDDAVAQRLTQRGSPFELGEFSTGGTSNKVFIKGPTTLFDIFIKANSFTKRDFIVDGDLRLSFEESFGIAAKWVALIEEKFKLSNNRRVAIVLPNSIEWVIAFIAITLAGGVVVTVHSNSTPNNVLEALNTANCVSTITTYELAQSLFNLGNRRPALIADTQTDTLCVHPNWVFLPCARAQIAGGNGIDLINRKRPAPTDEALIAFTSGSTGIPKGVVLTHQNMVTGLMNMMLGGAITSFKTSKEKADKPPALALAPCTMVLSPLSHISGYAQILLMCHVAGKIVLMRHWDVSDAITTIEKEKVRSLSGATTDMLKELVRANSEGRNLSSLMGFNIHGSALHTTLADEITTAFPHAVVGTGYGMTETCGSTCVVAGNDLRRRPQTCGQPLPSVNIRCVNSTGEDVACGQVGEVWIRGAMLMKGYCTASNDASEQPDDGWLKTGDLGRFDAEGYLYIVDRIQNIINLGDRQVSLTEIEHRITTHPLIEDAAAFSVKDSRHNEHLVLAIISRGDGNQLAISRDIELHLSALGIGAKIIFPDFLPRTVSGKINRNELKNWFMDSTENNSLNNLTPVSHGEIDRIV